jgi:hypothetical protein
MENFCDKSRDHRGTRLSAACFDPSKILGQKGRTAYRRAVNLRYRDLLELTERLYALPRSRGVATESRIKNFSRLNYPAGPRVGTGERADYGAVQVVQLLVGFELLRHRMPPAVIVELVRTEWNRIAPVFADTAKAILDAVGKDVTRLLLVDSLALHEVGKTIRAGELLSTIEIVDAAQLADVLISGAGRSWLLINPEALIREASELMPLLRRPRSIEAFLTAVSNMEAAGSRSSNVDNRMPPDWAEEGYSRRRALADALAVLREAPPLTPDRLRTLTSPTTARLVAAIGDFTGPLAAISVDGRTGLDAALAIYIDWIGMEVSPAVPLAAAADSFILKTSRGTPEVLYRELLELVCTAIGIPVQDV